jgi:hypothetical protein
VVGSVVGGAVVILVVGTTVATVVGTVVTSAGAACWVHAAHAAKTTRKIIKPILFFMESKLKFTFN